MRRYGRCLRKNGWPTVLEERDVFFGREYIAQVCKVETGMESGGYIEIRSGLTAGQKVVLEQVSGPEIMNGAEVSLQ